MFSAVNEKLDQLLWHTEVDSDSWLQVHLLQASRIFYGAIRDIVDGLPSLRAMSLVYTTLLSMAPLLAVSFSVLKGFGVHNQLEPALNSLLEPLGEKGLEISQQIISFVDNINVRMLGAIGLLVLFVTVLTLAKKVESAFNFTWRITTTRSFIQRFTNYLSVILLAPLLLFASAGLTASFNSSSFVGSILAIEPFGSMLLLIGELVPYLLTMLSFTFIFVLIPNTRVKVRSALYGAFFATILWKSSGAIFTAFIVNSTNYTAIYSGFAILIIFMIWIYISWLIILTGASIVYYHQHPECIHNKSKNFRLSCQLREKLALTIMQLIASHFHFNKEMWSSRSLAQQTGVSEPVMRTILSDLTSHKLLVPTGDDGQYYLPSRSLENISLHDILMAARIAEDSHYLQIDEIASTQSIDQTVRDIEEAIVAATGKKSLRDLIQSTSD